MDAFKNLLNERGLPGKRGRAKGIRRGSNPEKERGGDGLRWRGRKGEGSGGSGTTGSEDGEGV